jgi:benzil reductase ((S)-benzoin forming)
MIRSLYIVTGASRGLGAAMAEQLLAPGTQLLCISRRTSEALALKAGTAQARCEQWAMDLATPLPVAHRLSAWLAQIDHTSFDTATLINNAGVLTRVGPLGHVDGTDVSNALRVGLEAPLLLTAAFLRATLAWPTRRRVLQISSGLGRRAMAGQAIYAAAKAGLDHAARTIALDEALQPNGAKIVSLAPGVIDTEMQARLRDNPADGFPDQALFVNLQRTGGLSAPAEAAARVLAYLDRADFGLQPVADVRDA